MSVCTIVDVPQKNKRYVQLSDSDSKLHTAIHAKKESEKRRTLARLAQLGKKEDSKKLAAAKAVATLVTKTGPRWRAQKRKAVTSAGGTAKKTAKKAKTALPVADGIVDETLDELKYEVTELLPGMDTWGFLCFLRSHISELDGTRFLYPSSSIHHHPSSIISNVIHKHFACGLGFVRGQTIMRISDRFEVRRF